MPILDNATVVFEKTDTSEQVEHPKNYNVIMWNDDVTPMEVVISVLENIFQKDFATAVVITLSIHLSDKGIVGAYPMEQAFKLVETAENYLKRIGQDTLVMTVEEA